MILTSRWARPVLAAVGALGIAAAHWVAYGLATSNPHAHDELLASTGHRYWLIAGSALAALVAGTVGLSIVRRLYGGGSRPTLVTALTLVFLQVGGFTLLEYGERALFADHHAPEAFLTQPVFWIGVVLQVVAALAATMLLRALLGFVDFVRRALSRPFSRAQAPRLASRPGRLWIPRPRLGASGSSTRGPPALLPTHT